MPQAERRARPRAAGGGYAPEETRRALVSSALTLFGRNGYAATSVQEIADLAGVTKGAFYHHFDSKADLLCLIHDEFVDVQLDAMRRILAEYEAPADQVRELLRAFLLSVEKYQANVTVFFHERRYLTGQRFEAVKNKRDQFDMMFLAVIERGIERGDFRRDVDPRIVGLGIIGMCAWTYQWFRPGGVRTSREIADIFAEIVIGGLLAR